MAVLPHIKKLDDAFGHFLVQITCKCGARRIAEPEALTRLCGPSATLETVSRRMRCSKCGTRGAEVVAVSVPRIRGSWLERRGLLGEPDRPIAPTNKPTKAPPPRFRSCSAQA
jgi:hypothetical protein